MPLRPRGETHQPSLPHPHDGAPASLPARPRCEASLSHVSLYATSVSTARPGASPSFATEVSAALGHVAGGGLAHLLPLDAERKQR